MSAEKIGTPIEVEGYFTCAHCEHTKDEHTDEGCTICDCWVYAVDTPHLEVDGDA